MYKPKAETIAGLGFRRCSAVWRCSLHFFLPLVAENAKIHNMEQKLAERDLVSDLQMMGLTELC